MSWQTVLGHDDVVEQFRRRLAAGRVNGTFLFVGPAGIGKRMFAVKLAQALLCQGGNNRSLDPCGNCEDCRLSAAGTHPDLLEVRKPPDKSELPLRLLIGEGDNRMREGLCHDIGLKPFRGGRRIAIIDDADDLNTEGANCLLKTLEEPPPRSVMILIGTSPDRQLPTIRSRAQLVRFQPLSTEDAAAVIERAGLADNSEAARQLAIVSQGSLEAARRLADPDFAAFREAWIGRLAEPWDAAATVQALIAFADGAGKEPGAKRERLRWALGTAVEFYRAALHASLGVNVGTGTDLASRAEGAGAATAVDAESLTAVIERFLKAIEHVDRNVHPTTLAEALCDDVGRLLNG